MLDNTSKVDGVPGNSIGLNDKNAVSGSSENISDEHRQVFGDRGHALRSFCNFFLNSYKSVKRVLGAMNKQGNSMPSGVSTKVKAYFKTDNVSVDVSRQLINDLLAAESISVDTVLDTLTSAAMSYLIDSERSVKDDIAKVFVDAFLRLKDRCPSEDFKESVGEVLWNIYRCTRRSSTISRNARWTMIDANLLFNQWRKEDDFFELKLMAKYYCSINRPDPEKLAALVDVIKCKSGDNSEKKFRAIFSGVATEYFAVNASDASVARVVIDALTWLFENGEVYDKYDHFGSDDVVYRDLPENIELHDALVCCVNWFFNEDYLRERNSDYLQKRDSYYLSEKSDSQKNSSLLSELIGALLKKEKGDYDVVELAQSVYEEDGDVRKQLCLVESLILLEEQNTRELSGLSFLIDSVIDFYLEQIKNDPDKIKELSSLVSSGQYSDRCKTCVVKKLS